MPQLPFVGTVLFAASCCEQLLPYYRAFMEETGWGDAEALRDALDIVWSVPDRAFDESTVNRAITRCESVVPDTEDFSSSYTSAAMEAGNTIAMALEFCLSGDIRLVADIATSTIDSIGMIEESGEIRVVPPPYDSDGPGSLATAEMSRQRAALDYLSTVERFDRTVVEHLLGATDGPRQNDVRHPRSR